MYSSIRKRKASQKEGRAVPETILEDGARKHKFNFENLDVRGYATETDLKKKVSSGSLGSSCLRYQFICIYM